MRLRVILATLWCSSLLWRGIIAPSWSKQHARRAGGSGPSFRDLSYAFEENIRRSSTAIDITIRALRVARAHDPVHFDLAGWERDSGLTRELTLQLNVPTKSAISSSPISAQ